MEKTLGARIASLRRKKSMTQEALARAVGVSAPAVSKWETDASCPDIALLCPLARALGTNVDTLLAFEEELNLRTDQQPDQPPRPDGTVRRYFRRTGGNGEAAAHLSFKRGAPVQCGTDDGHVFADGHGE